MVLPKRLAKLIQPFYGVGFLQVSQIAQICSWPFPISQATIVNG